MAMTLSDRTETEAPIAHEDDVIVTTRDRMGEMLAAIAERAFWRPEMTVSDAIEQAIEALVVQDQPEVPGWTVAGARDVAEALGALDAVCTRLEALDRSALLPDELRPSLGIAMSDVESARVLIRYWRPVHGAMQVR